MFSNTIKPIIAGILAGTILFFTWPFVIIILVLKFIFTPFGMFRWRGAHWGGPGFHHRSFSMAGAAGPYSHFADRIRNMSDEEYAEMKKKMQNRYPGCNHQR